MISLPRVEQTHRGTGQEVDRHDERCASVLHNESLFVKSDLKSMQKHITILRENCHRLRKQQLGQRLIALRLGHHTLHVPGGNVETRASHSRRHRYPDHRPQIVRRVLTGI